MDRRNPRPGLPDEGTYLPPDSALCPGINVRPGVSFSIATEARPLDPLSRELRRGVFPPLSRPLLRLVEAIVPPGGRVLDLGAHIGTFALAVAATGRDVLAVEASRRNVALLDASRRINQFANLRLVHAAVADAPGEVWFRESGPFGQVVPAGASGGEASATRALAVDDLLADVGWASVDFIKVDVEGSEVAALVGMAGLLHRDDAPPLLIESNGHTLHPFGETPASLKAALFAYGYRLYQVEDRRLSPVGLDDYQAATVVDYLAVKGTPIPPARWRLDPPMPPRERARRVRAACLSTSEAERHYAARTIGQAPESIRSDRRVARAIEALRRDPVDAIRSAASAWRFASRRRPWYAVWRR